MPLIEKHILVERSDGSTVDRSYYVQEERRNPYAGVNKLKEAEQKVRRFGRKKIRPDEKGYMWSMGYNNIVGTYSPGGKYSRFSGSSLNRNKSMHDKDKNLGGGAEDSLALARKVAGWYYRRSAPLPAPVRDYLVRQSPSTEARFRVWLSDEDDRAEESLSLPIYKLSARSRGKIKDKATAFFRGSPGDRIFCTLTFVAPVDDRTGVAILNKFLTSLRKQFPNLQYLWVAERQGNGNIHFHVILNKRLPIRRYNALWVMQQYNSGLRGQTKFGIPVSMEEVRKMYERGTIHHTFNPVDIKKVRSIAGLSSYLTKYITKQDNDVFFGCSPWHCSRGVSRLFTRTAVGPSAFAYMMKIGNNAKVDRSTGEAWAPTSVRPKGAGGAFCVIVYANRKEAPLPFLKEMEQINKWMLKGHVLDKLSLIDDDEYRSVFCKN